MKTRAQGEAGIVLYIFYQLNRKTTKTKNSKKKQYKLFKCQLLVKIGLKRRRKRINCRNPGIKIKIKKKKEKYNIFEGSRSQVKITKLGNTQDIESSPLKKTTSPRAVANSSPPKRK